MIALLSLTGWVALLGCLSAVPGRAADYGRVAGTVKDAEGNPLVGVTILLIGPTLPGLPGATAAAERVITDAHGAFSVERLKPGWYSIKATAVTRLPSRRDRIRVGSGRTATQDFVLSEIFVPARFHLPQGGLATWGDDWKWVLRTSAGTRPVLRYRQVSTPTTTAAPSKKARKTALPSQRLVGMVPGSARHNPLADDPGLGSVLAYLRPLSDDADLLVAGSMTSNGIQGSSLATAFRRNMLNGDPQELTLSMHELNFSEAPPLIGNGSFASVNRAQGMVVSYSTTRQLSDSLRLTTGFEIDYLNSVRAVAVARPRMELAYQMDPSTAVAVRYGSVRPDAGDETLLERIGELSAFPRVTMRGYRPALEQLNHAEVSVDRRLGKSSRAEAAVYQDGFQNTAVWGTGSAAVVTELAGNVMPNPASSGMTLNAGSYRSSGFRAQYSRRFSDVVEAAVMYASGDALAATPDAPAVGGLASGWRQALRPERSRAMACKVSTRAPRSRTQVIASYEFLSGQRVTTVDPYGEANLGVHPYLDLQVRQPLPNLAFLPAHIEAMADFRNLLAQGYVPVGGSGEEALFLAPAYRSFRGGFSVQF